MGLRAPKLIFCVFCDRHLYATPTYRQPWQKCTWSTYKQRVAKSWGVSHLLTQQKTGDSLFGGFTYPASLLQPTQRVQGEANSPREPTFNGPHPTPVFLAKGDSLRVDDERRCPTRCPPAVHCRSGGPSRCPPPPCTEWRANLTYFPFTFSFPPPTRCLHNLKKIKGNWAKWVM